MRTQTERTKWQVGGLGLAMGLMLVTGPLSGQTIPRAAPVDDDAMEVPRAIPVGPDGKPLNAPTTPPSNQPKGPDEDLFQYASMLYERGEFGLAMQSYNQYLQEYPSGRHIATALFRIGESLVKQGQTQRAEPFFDQVVNRYPDSEGAPSAAYRLGAIRFNQRMFADSVRYFRFCEQKTQVPQVRLAAAYNRSRGHQMMRDEEGQLQALREVIAVTEDNPYREAALLILARSALAKDELDRAEELFTEILEIGKDGDVRSQAMVNLAAIAAERGEQDKAIDLFEQVLDIPEATTANRGIALVGVVQALYEKADYDGVIENYNRNAAVLPDGLTRAKMLLWVGNAFRMKKIYSRAVEVYLMLEQDFPEEDVAFEAGYWKLYCFYLLEDPDIAEFANGYLLRWSGRKKGHKFIANAALIRADHYFNVGDYENAAQAFLSVPMSDLSESLRPNALFNKGYSQVEAGRYQAAISTLSRFLSDNPTHELQASALAQRGVAHRQVRDLRAAKEDFTKVTQEFGRSPSSEMAYYQLGLIAEEERNYTAQIAAFEKLTALFPQSQAVPQAWFSIGNAAYEMEDWPTAIDALERAIRLDPEAYFETGSQTLILCHYADEDRNGLAKAIDAYLKKNPNGLVAPNILGWLGLSLFSVEDFKGCAKYLELAVTPDAPENTQAVLWNYLGMSQVENGAFRPAIMSLNNYLEVTPQPGADRGKALLFRSRAELGAEQYDKAMATADEALKFIKTGRLQAQLLIQQGDTLVATAEAQWDAGKTDLAKETYKAAAAKFIIPSQFFVDPEITPTAVHKTILALERSGDRDRARQLKEELARKYPDFKRPS